MLAASGDRLQGRDMRARRSGISWVAFDFLVRRYRSIGKTGRGACLPRDAFFVGYKSADKVDGLLCVLAGFEWLSVGVFRLSNRCWFG